MQQNECKNLNYHGKDRATEDKMAGYTQKGHGV